MIVSTRKDTPNQKQISKVCSVGTGTSVQREGSLVETDLDVSRDDFIVNLTGHIVTWGYVALDVPVRLFLKRFKSRGDDLSLTCTALFPGLRSWAE